MTDSTPTESTPVLTRDQIVGDLAEVLDIAPGEIADDTNVLDIGLDSVRLMSLIERWRAQGAHRADVILPGATLTFNTGAPEIMEVIAGQCAVQLKGDNAVASYGAGQSFSVPGNSAFDITVSDTLHYVCHFG